MPNVVLFGGVGPAGSGLMMSDGTPAGTRLISPEVLPWSVRNINAVAGGRVLFEAWGVDDWGYALWVTDGTATGTARLTDSTWFPMYFTALGNGKLLFNADNRYADTGRELWVTDGTAAGTYMLRDIRPFISDQDNSNSSDPRDITPLGDGRALFTANDGVTGRELWITDGTSAGTHLVKDLFINSYPGTMGSSYPGGITPLGDGRALFAARDNTAPGLWVTDGTAAGTELLFVSAPFNWPQSITPLGDGRILFVGAPIRLFRSGRGGSSGSPTAPALARAWCATSRPGA
jgi:ELWxxDGT repeat protein